MPELQHLNDLTSLARLRPTHCRIAIFVGLRRICATIEKVRHGVMMPGHGCVVKGGIADVTRPVYFRTGRKQDLDIADNAGVGSQVKQCITVTIGVTRADVFQTPEFWSPTIFISDLSDGIMHPMSGSSCYT